MRAFLIAASLASVLAYALLGEATAIAQEPEDTIDSTRDELATAGVPLLNSPLAPIEPQAAPGQADPDGQPQAIPVDLPIPDPTDWIPNPTDWIPGGLNPLNWAGDIVNAVFTIVGKALLEAMRGFVDWALGFGDSSLNFVTQTPAEGTYDSTTVRSLWDFSRAIVNAALAVIVMWGGFNVIIKEHTRSPYHEAMELLPRVILAALAANLTIEFARLLIDVNNAISAAIGQVGLPGYDQATPSQEGIALIFTAAAYGIVAILLVFQMLMRLALLAMLIVLGPVAALMWVLPQTQQWTRWWVDLFTITVFQQAVQVMVLRLGSSLMVELTPGSMSNALLTMLLGLAVCWLTLKVPSLLRSSRSGAGVTNVVTLAVASHALGALGAAGRAGASAGSGAAGGGGAAAAATRPASGRA
ncbi:type IV secretion system protein [bacterium]|nr:type IV secretion system protein [bacterium]